MGGQISKTYTVNKAYIETKVKDLHFNIFMYLNRDEVAKGTMTLNAKEKKLRSFVRDLYPLVAMIRNNNYIIDTEDKVTMGRIRYFKETGMQIVADFPKVGDYDLQKEFAEFCHYFDQ